MKKLLILTLLLLSTVVTTATAQARLNMTLAEIQKDFPAYEYSGVILRQDNGNKTYSIQDEYRLIYYLLDERDISFATVIVPKTKGEAQAIIEKYNNRYVIVSDTQWRFYDDNGSIMNCELRISEGQYFFWWD